MCSFSEYIKTNLCSSINDVENVTVFLCFFAWFFPITCHGLSRQNGKDGYTSNF